MIRSDLEKELEHSAAAYRFALRSLPDSQKIKSGPVNSNGFVFTKESQVNSMMIELGWAFFCRYEGCFEAFLKEHKVPLSKNLTLEKWLDSNDIIIPIEYREALERYRKIRNWLHHRDGQNEDGSEIHIYPDHMEKFYVFFIWAAAAVAKISAARKDPQ